MVKESNCSLKKPNYVKVSAIKMVQNEVSWDMGQARSRGNEHS